MPTPSYRPRTVVALVVAAAVALTITSVTVTREHATHAQRAARALSPKEPTSISILGSGDILVHPPTWAQAARDSTAGRRYDFGPVFADIRADVTDADLAICHLEAPMGPGAPEDFPRFRAPVELGPAIKATGYDTCSTASNHSMDQGERGVYDNLGALDAAGLAHTGTYRTPKDALTPTLYTVKGVKIGHLSYSFGFNGIPRPAGKPWVANRIDIQAVLGAARAARTAGAQIVVLSIHAGTELDHDPDKEQEAWITRLIASPDIDLVLGHHAHVVQPMQRFGDEWVAYGLGNTLARHDFPIDDNREGVLGKFTFTRNPHGRWKVTRAEAIPIWLSLKPNVRILSLPRAVERLPATDSRRRAYQHTINRIAGYLDRRGAVASGLVIHGAER